MVFQTGYPSTLLETSEFLSQIHRASVNSSYPELGIFQRCAFPFFYNLCPPKFGQFRRRLFAGTQTASGGHRHGMVQTLSYTKIKGTAHRWKIQQFCLKPSLPKTCAPCDLKILRFESFERIPGSVNHATHFVIGANEQAENCLRKRPEITENDTLQ